MKLATPLNRLKVPFGTAKFCRLRNAHYLTWRDVVGRGVLTRRSVLVDGIAFLETHQRFAEQTRSNATLGPFE